MNSDHLELMADRRNLALYKDFAIFWSCITVFFMLMAIVSDFTFDIGLAWMVYYLFIVGGFVVLPLAWVSIYVGLNYKVKVEAGEKLRDDYALLRRRWPASVPCPTFEEYKRGYDIKAMVDT